MANSTVTYTRKGDGHTEKLVVMSYLSDEVGGDDEIRVIKSLDDRVVGDDIALHPGNGRQWLSQRHAEWLADGYSVISQE